MHGTAIAAFSAGTLLVVAARHLRVPAIAPLLLGGIALGPEGLGLVRPDELGPSLRTVVSMAVALVLFEGGLSLDVRGYRQAPSVIRRMLTVGAFVTWGGTTLSAWLLFDIPITYALLLGSLVMVTGPTVITPILRRVRVKERLHHILHWEGVLIDPVGVFVAVLCFEFLQPAESITDALILFGWRTLVGGVFGVVGGLGIATALRRELIPDDLTNVGVLACVMTIFGLSEWLAMESGILSVVVAGMVVTLQNPPKLNALRDFKEELTQLAVGVLFILLAARLRFEDFTTLGANGALLVGVVLLLRPIGIILSTVGKDLSWRERAFLSWMAPRGIVAASMASLFALELEGSTPGSGKLIEAFTYAVIGVTVLLQGTTAGFVARILDVEEKTREGWLIVGAHRFAREVATFLRDHVRVPVVLLDRDPVELGAAVRSGHHTLAGDALDPSLQDHTELAPVGNVLALTDNEDLNFIVAQTWQHALGGAARYRWASTDYRASHAGGTAVWTDCPRPSAISHELETRAARLLVTDGGAPPRGDATTMLEVREGSVSWTPRGPDEIEGIALRLWLAHRSRSLPALIREERVLTLHVRTLDEALRLCVEAAQRDSAEFDADTVLHELLERERSVPTAIGHGVGVPHIYCEGLRAPLCVVARIPEGLDLGHVDETPLRLLFLLLSAPGDPQGHLNRLAEIGTLALHESVVDRLVAAPDHEAIRHIIVSHLTESALD